MPEKAQQEQRSFDHNEDRFPTLKKVFAAVLNEPEIPDTGVLRVEIGCQANGEATYRVWTRGAEEEIGGFLPAGF
jgi:hypothetical protein